MWTHELRCPGRLDRSDERPTGREEIDAVVLTVGDDDLPVGHDRYPSRERERSVAGPVAPPRVDEPTLGVELLDPVIERIRDVQNSTGAVGRVPWLVEASVRRALPAEGRVIPRIASRDPEALDPEVEGVADREQTAVHEHAVRRAEPVPPCPEASERRPLHVCPVVPEPLHPGCLSFADPQPATRRRDRPRRVELSVPGARNAEVIDTISVPRIEANDAIVIGVRHIDIAVGTDRDIAGAVEHHRGTLVRGPLDDPAALRELHHTVRIGVGHVQARVVIRDPVGLCERDVRVTLLSELLLLVAVDGVESDHAIVARVEDPQLPRVAGIDREVTGVPPVAPAVPHHVLPTVRAERDDAAPAGVGHVPRAVRRRVPAGGVEGSHSPGPRDVPGGVGRDHAERGRLDRPQRHRPW